MSLEIGFPLCVRTDRPDEGRAEICNRKTTEILFPATCQKTDSHVSQ